jgi:hypothetical protein
VTSAVVPMSRIEYFKEMARTIGSNGGGGYIDQEGTGGDICWPRLTR